MQNATGVTIPPDILNAVEGVDFNQVTNVLKEKCAKNSGSDAAYEEAEVRKLKKTIWTISNL